MYFCKNCDTPGTDRAVLTSRNASPTYATTRPIVYSSPASSTCRVLSTRRPM